MKWEILAFKHLLLMRMTQACRHCHLSSPPIHSKCLFLARKASYSPTYSDFFIVQDFKSPTKASHRSTCFFPISYHSLRQPPKITRKLPHNQSVRVSPWFQQCFVSSNQPCYA
ncbi:hypothetical protein BLNAU_21733 [Blattamonas nauphoetae]|uniref:Secreted protein n=1 Tax=Blattamonas nauphoetae TaxID=2049346 RepID=A0ABQ9WW49_9EUKA|nr:hypothetical protein BLNAU_21733 [Blattamonas nauphoetae]